MNNLICCSGYHVLPIINPDEITECSIPFTTYPAKGWKLVEDKISKYRFSPDGRSAWLCPDCVKQYEQEVRDVIESILAKEITEYWLYARCCKTLDRLGATIEDWKRFHNNLPKKKMNVFWNKG